MLRKAAGGGMSAAAGLMVVNTKPLRRLEGAMTSAPYEWLFTFYLDRNQKSHAELLDSPDAPSPTTVVLRVAEHMAPHPLLVRDALRMVLKAHPNSAKASPVEEEELLELSTLLQHDLYRDDATVQVLYLRTLLRRRVYTIALERLVALPSPWITASLWRETIEAVTMGRLNHTELLSRLLDEQVFPVRLRSTTYPPADASTSRALALPRDAAGIEFGFDASLASKLLLATPRLPAISHAILKKYIRSTEMTRSELHPTPFLVFFKCVQEVREPHAKTPMVHWKLVLRYFQLLNRSCPTWYATYPSEAADLVRYVILTCSSGANPFLTLNIARVAASRRILDGVELSIWLIHRMVLSHHVEETRDVAHRLVQWLFHTIGVHLIPKFHPQIVPLARSLLSIEAVPDVVFMYNVVIDHVQLFSQAFRTEWMLTLKDLLCACCGSVLQERNVHEDRVCHNCMHVTPAKSLTETASYASSAEQLEWMRRKRRAHQQESKLRMKKFVTDGSLHTESRASIVTSATTPDGQAPTTAEDLFKAAVLSPSVGPELQIGDNSDLRSLVLSGDASPTDVRAAVEEASRRKELLDAMRNQNIHSSTAVADQQRFSASVPSVIPELNASMRNQFRAARERAIIMQTVRVDGPWQCVWCQEQNTTVTDSRIQCCACGAETGPEAPWRTFMSENSGDVQQEIRLRIRSGDSADALIAAYNLTVYRRSFLMMATDDDYVLLEDLLLRLVNSLERVLAGYLFMRMIPGSRRPHCLPLMHGLANLYGNAISFSEAVERGSLNFSNDQDVFNAIFNAEKSCKVCFGLHTWQQCPIITRDFSKTKISINLTAEEKHYAAFRHLKESIAAAVAVTIGPGNATAATQASKLRRRDVSQAAEEATHIAYQQFIVSNREKFACDFPVDTNNLSRALSYIGEYVRASFVLCNIPVHLRFDASYADVAGYYGVSVDDCGALLKKRSAVGILDGSHPNFVQVARVCCMCLEKQHASFLCPKLDFWVAEVKSLFRIEGAPQGSQSAGATELCVVVNPNDRLKRIAMLRAQVDGWIHSGPERLLAFHRFLLEHLEELIDTKTDDINPGLFAFNSTVTRLLETNQQSLALKLYARLPTKFVWGKTTAAFLKAAGYSADAIAKLDGTTLRGRDVTFHPNDVCLCCFESGHAFVECPEVLGHASWSRIVHVIDTVGCIRSSPCGVRAAADYVYREYNFSRLTTEVLRAHPEAVRAIVKLMHRCFATGLIGRGVRLLRRVPIEMLELQHYQSMWKATGMPADLVADRMQILVKLFEDQGLAPNCATPQARQTLQPEFITTVAGLIHGDHCRHCYEYGHNISKCNLFREEAEFGRDFMAMYRIVTLMPSLFDNERISIYASLARFLLEHQVGLPYYILGVHNGIGALSASLSMDNEPGLALRVLLLLPPAYRKKHSIHYALQALGVPKIECIRTLSNFYVPGDLPPPLLQHRGDEHATGAAADAVMQPQHLLVLRPPIPDLLVDRLLASVPGALPALQRADERLEPLALRGLVPRPFIQDDEERQRMHIPVDFAEASRQLMGAVGCSYSASLAAASPSDVLPAPKEHGPQQTLGPNTSKNSASSRIIRIKQLTEIGAIREAFSPLVDFMEAVAGVKFGSRSDMLYVSEVLEEEAARIEEQSAHETTSQTNSTNHPAASAAATSHDVPSGSHSDRSAPKGSVAEAIQTPTSRTRQKLDVGANTTPDRHKAEASSNHHTHRNQHSRNRTSSEETKSYHPRPSNQHGSKHQRQHGGTDSFHRRGNTGHSQSANNYRQHHRQHNYPSNHKGEKKLYNHEGSNQNKSRDSHRNDRSSWRQSSEPSQ